MNAQVIRLDDYRQAKARALTEREQAVLEHGADILNSLREQAALERAVARHLAAISRDLDGSGA